MIAATPPADHLLDLGLTDTAKTYPLLVDRRYASPAEDALKDVEAGGIDAAILWGPIGGYFAGKASPPLSARSIRTPSVCTPSACHLMPGGEATISMPLLSPVRPRTPSSQ